MARNGRRRETPSSPSTRSPRAPRASSRPAASNRVPAASNRVPTAPNPMVPSRRSTTWGDNSTGVVAESDRSRLGYVGYNAVRGKPSELKPKPRAVVKPVAPRVFSKPKASAATEKETPKRRTGVDPFAKSKQLERNGIASTTVRKSRTEGARVKPKKKEKSPAPTERVDAKRRRAKPDKSALSNLSARSSAAPRKDARKATGKKFVGYDALEGKPKVDRNCKPRPDDTEPKGGGGGSRDFVPWCS